MAETPYQIAFNEGINAALAGKQITDCPYCAPTMRWHAWILGFDTIPKSS